MCSEDGEFFFIHHAQGLQANERVAIGCYFIDLLLAGVSAFVIKNEVRDERRFGLRLIEDNAIKNITGKPFAPCRTTATAPPSSG